MATTTTAAAANSVSVPLGATSSLPLASTLSTRTPLPNPSRVLVPPINFALVVPGVYRSGHPNRKNFGFLRTLGLKGVVYVEGTDEYRPDSMDFVKDDGLTLYRFDLSNEDALFTKSGRLSAFAALQIILDTRTHPLLIHDDTGKSACTLLCALVRRVQGWSLTGVFAEGDMFAGAGGSEGGGIGDAGREFVAMFDPAKIGADPAHLPDWA